MLLFNVSLSGPTGMLSQVVTSYASELYWVFCRQRTLSLCLLQVLQKAMKRLGFCW